MEETTEPDQTFAPIPEPGLVLSTEAKYYLHTAGRWATFLGIVGFVFTGLIVLAALFIGTLLSVVSRLNPAALDSSATPGMPTPSSILGAASGFISFIYILIAVFYFFMSYYLYRFGTGIKKSTFLSDPIGAGKSFEYLKSHFKLIGITTIVFIALYILIFVGAIIISVIAASAVH